MAQLVAFLPMALSAGAKIVGGIQRKREAEGVAGQLERRAGETRASSQREAIEARRQGRLRSSRALAVAAAGGGSASDPDIINRLADLESEGEFGALKALYEGSTASDFDLKQASVTRRGGKRQLISSLLSAGGDIGSTILQRQSRKRQLASRKLR